jgi:energy-coupling factor transport system substrate-specific component
MILSVNIRTPRERAANMPVSGKRAVADLALVAVSAAGLIAFFFPFLVSSTGVAATGGMNRAVDSSLLLAILVGGSLLIAVGEQARGAAPGGLTRSIALLGVLVAIDASLRLAPSLAGASPIFALIILVGYVYGARFGFVMGALTLLLSAAITAGVGPWLPFQMLCAGWIGMAAGWLPHNRGPFGQLATLAAFGAATGFAFGALMNLYSWPFAAPGVESDVGLFWTPSLPLAESLRRYSAYYLTTSLAHDATRALGTAVLLAIAAPATLRLLRRFQIRSSWSQTTSS